MKSLSQNTEPSINLSSMIDDSDIVFLDTKAVAEYLGCSLPTARQIMYRSDFPLIFSGEEQIFLLNDHQIAALLRAMFEHSRAYAQGESPPIVIDDPMVKLVFVGLFRAVRDRFDEYRHKCEINSINARGHGAPKGNQNARKHTDEEIKQAREGLTNGDLSAARILVDAAVQHAKDTYDDG